MVGRAVEVEVEVEVERIMNGPFAAVRGQKKGEGGQRVKGYMVQYGVGVGGTREKEFENIHEKLLLL